MLSALREKYIFEKMHSPNNLSFVRENMSVVVRFDIFCQLRQIDVDFVNFVICLLSLRLDN